MPFAQVHYPFENREWFEHHYPGDFIVEYIGQTRGWFYTLHVLATALFDRPAFATCVSHGIVLGDDGQKMSKSLRNYPDPMGMFDIHGADAMRWYLLSSSILRGSDFSVTEQGIRDTVRQVLLPLWNSWYFLSLYANAENATGSFRVDSTNVLDRYVLAKLRDTVLVTTRAMDEADLFGACQHVRVFLDVLTNWYIRRSRDRFWSGDQDAIDTLHSVLDVVVRLVAPLLPLIADEVFTGLYNGEKDSVHLADWPDADQLPADTTLVQAMDLVRDVCSSALSVRKAHNRRVRQPLQTLTVAADDASLLDPFVEIIAEEMNVKQVALRADVDAVAQHELQVVPAMLGPRLGPRTQQVIIAVKKGDWKQVGDTIEVAGEVLQPGEFSMKLVTASSDASATLAGGRGIVMLDLTLTDELVAEGMARDVIRAVQQARREADLDVSDRIDLVLGADDQVRSALKPYESMISEETLAVSLEWNQSASRSIEIEGGEIYVSVTVKR
jgi:isoleucyl-tRNA synthetase